ncbi:hypothetical protein Ptr902_07715 [Pyrenophora tritici-repentis]|nr:hypothetical protein Ptr902_07715 [Pyrenophora tritici-repentis]
MSPIPLHTVAILPLISGLKNAHAFITKASVHCTTTSTPPEDFLTASLHPTMKDLRYQVYRFTDAAKFLPIRLNPALADRELKIPDEEQSFEELLERIQKTLRHLEEYKASDFEGVSNDDVIEIKFPGGKAIRMGVADHVARYSHPNFWFHVTTAYAVLRMKGVDLGKLDFLNGAGEIEILDLA